MACLSSSGSRGCQTVYDAIGRQSQSATTHQRLQCLEGAIPGSGSFPWHRASSDSPAKVGHRQPLLLRQTAELNRLPSLYRAHLPLQLAGQRSRTASAPRRPKSPTDCSQRRLLLASCPPSDARAQLRLANRILLATERLVAQGTRKTLPTQVLGNSGRSQPRIRRAPATVQPESSDRWTGQVKRASQGALNRRQPCLREMDDGRRSSLKLKVTPANGGNRILTKCTLLPKRVELCVSTRRANS